MTDILIMIIFIVSSFVLLGIGLWRRMPILAFVAGALWVYLFVVSFDGVCQTRPSTITESSNTFNIIYSCIDLSMSAYMQYSFAIIGAFLMLVGGLQQKYG